MSNARNVPLAGVFRRLCVGLFASSSSTPSVAPTLVRAPLLHVVCLANTPRLSFAADFSPPTLSRRVFADQLFPSSKRSGSCRPSLIAIPDRHTGGSRLPTHSSPGFAASRRRCDLRSCRQSGAALPACRRVVAVVVASVRLCRRLLVVRPRRPNNRNTHRAPLWLGSCSPPRPAARRLLSTRRQCRAGPWSSSAMHRVHSNNCVLVVASPPRPRSTPRRTRSSCFC